MGKPVVVQGTAVSQPVVVQGTAVSQPYNPYEPETTALADESVAPVSSTGAGEKQPAKCRDPIFALLLIGNVVAITAVGGIYGTIAFDQTLNNDGYDYSGYIVSAIILGVMAMIFTGLCLPIMLCIPEHMIKVSIIGMLVLSGAMMAISFITGNFIGGIIGIVFFLMFAWNARAVWSRIPFANANLLTACTAVKKNCGLVFVAYVYVIVAFGWSFLWSVALDGISPENSINFGYFFLMLLSFFFTHQVIQYCLHVTVSGTVGAWWYSPEDSGCCSGGVMGSAIRSLTTSFGSICFGSLLVAIVQILKPLVAQLVDMSLDTRAARSEEGGSFLLCLEERTVQSLADLVKHFNKWAFVYVGLYGYSYIDAGRNVTILFKNREWEANIPAPRNRSGEDHPGFIADNLIQNVFFFLSLSVGGVCAGIGYAIPSFGDGSFDNAPSSGLSVESTIAFLGFIIGLVLSSILLSTIGSAVNAVIVCFAEGPAEFEANHPELSRKMRETWLHFYPDCGA